MADTTVPPVTQTKGLLTVTNTTTGMFTEQPTANQTESFTNVTSVTTTITTSTTEMTSVTSEMTSSQTTGMYGSIPTEGKDSKTSAIVGGAIGGVLGVIIIIALVTLFYRRWRRKKHPREVPPMAPGIDDLEKINMHILEDEGMNSGDGNQNHPVYTNLDKDGKPNERTDPDLDEDGYLKKQKQKRKKKQKSSEKQPNHPAPPPPGMEVYENMKTTKESATNQNGMMNQKPDKPPERHYNKKEPKYVNTRNQQEGVPNGEEYANTETNNQFQQENYENINTDVPGTGEPEELYENT